MRKTFNQKNNPQTIMHWKWRKREWFLSKVKKTNTLKIKQKQRRMLNQFDPLHVHPPHFRNRDSSLMYLKDRLPCYRYWLLISRAPMVFHLFWMIEIIPLD